MTARPRHEIFESRAVFLQQWGNTVAPELFPELWMDIPKEFCRALPPNVLHIKRNGLWVATSTVLMANVEVQYSHIMSGSRAIRRRDEHRTYELTLQYNAEGLRLLGDAYLETRSKTKFALSLSDTCCEFEGDITTLKHGVTFGPPFGTRIELTIVLSDTPVLTFTPCL